MTCQELVELVTDYLEGALPESDRARFDEHLGQCTGCRRYLSQMRRTIDTVGSLKEEDLTVEERRELLSLFDSWRESR